MDQPNVLRSTKIGNGFVKEDVLAYVDELNSQIYQLQEERDELAKKISSGGGMNQAKAQELEAEIDRLRGELGTARNQLRAAQEELQNRPVVQGDGQGISPQELQAVQQQLVDAQADLEAKDAELQLAQAETAEMNEKIVELEARIETLDQDNASLRTDLAEAAAQALTAGANPEQAAQIEAMRQRTEEAEAEIASLRSELDAKNAMIEESAGLSNEADLQKLAEYEAMLAEQSTALTDKDNEIKKLKAQIEDLQENGGDSSFDMGTLFMEAQATAKKITSEARRKADERIEEANKQADQTVKEANEKAEKLISDAKAEAETTIASANAQADETVKNANAEAEKKLNDADAQAIKTVADAEESVRQSLADAERRTKTTTETARTVRALLRSEIDSVSKKFGEIQLVLENLSGQAGARINEAKNVISEARSTVSDDDGVPSFDSFDEVANKSFSKDSAKEGKFEFDFDELAENASGTDGWN